MKKLTDDDLQAVSRTYSINNYCDPERLGIARNSFFLGAIFIRDKSKKPTTSSIILEADKYVEKTYFDKERKKIGRASYIEGATYMVNKL